MRNKTCGFDNNRRMEYAIAASVTAIFVIILLSVKPPVREKFDCPMDEETYSAFAEEFANGLPAPQKGGSAETTAYFKKQINKATRKILKDDDTELFRRFALNLADKKKELEELGKKDYSALQSLPSVNGRTRVVVLAEEVLNRSRYIFCRDRTEIMLNAVNATRTLTFPEIMNLEDAFTLVLYKKLGLLCARVCTLDKIRKAAVRIAKKPHTFKNDSDFRRLKKNFVFSKFCATELGYSTEQFDVRFDALADDTIFALSNVLDSLDNVKLFDFTAYYEPLKIVSVFETYEKSTPECRKAFLEELSRQSEKENLDETAYAVRLLNYSDYGKIPPVKLKRARIGGKTLAVCNFDGNILTLARALSSTAYMQMIFGSADAKSSILKNVKIKSSFMPKMRIIGTNFDFSVNDDKLSIKPNFPPEILSASLQLQHNGVVHTITIENGDEELSVNGTVFKGIPDVKLGDVPLDIKIRKPFEK